MRRIVDIVAPGFDGEVNLPRPLGRVRLTWISNRCSIVSPDGLAYGPPSWAEMERVLDGKPRRAGWPIDEQVGDGGDSPAWSRKRGGYQPPESTGDRPGSSVPYAELHAHSAYSFLDGASTPEELVEEAVRLDLRAIALTDHDGLYGVVRFAEAAKELQTCAPCSAPSCRWAGGDRTERPRSARTAPAGAGPRPGGLPAAVAAARGRASGRRREGQAALRLRRADRGGRRALAHPDRMPQRPCPPGAFRAAARRRPARRWPIWWTGSAATGSASS